MTIPVDAIKARLLTGGPVQVPADIELGVRASFSSAGPGAGRRSAVFSFGGVRVRKVLARSGGQFELVRGAEGYEIWEDGLLLTSGVAVEPILHHSPGQAFFNLEPTCVIGCAFCATPIIGRRPNRPSDRQVVARVLEAARAGGMKAVAFTSGVPETPAKAVERMARVIDLVRDELPTIPIGAEPYVTERWQVDMLVDAGADEIKLNLETYDRSIFARVCGRKDFDSIIASIAYAGEMFGRGKVSSNLIVGMGESDDSVRRGLEALADLGCVSVVRPLQWNERTEVALRRALGTVQPLTAERLLRLATVQGEVLRSRGLNPHQCRTMCHLCGSCDLVPFVGGP